MKKKLIPIILLFTMVLLFNSQQSISQEKKTSTVKITITEDEEITIDTTFDLAEGQDPEMIKKMVSHLAGEDIHTKHMKSDFNIDSIKQAHPDAKVLVIKDKNGEVTVKEVDDEHEMHFGGDDHAEHGEMMKEHKMIIVTESDCEGKEKKIEVIVDGDSDDENVWIEKGDGDENVEVYVIKTGDDDVKVVKKKVIVEIEEEDEGAEVEKTKKKKK